MYSLIVVTYRGPTDTKDARMRVTCGSFKPMTVPYPNELGGLRAYEFVARQYADSIGWADIPLVGGWIKGASAGFALAPKGV